MSENYYDSDRGASEYLLFHYGAPDLRPPPGCPEEPFPARCVNQLLDTALLPEKARALDLGCAVGRSSFELARFCAEVVGIDYSRQFIELANRLRQRGSLRFKSFEEGDLTQTRRAVVPPEIDRRRVKFETGDAMRLRKNLGPFDVVFMANLIDRLGEPMRCLAQLPELLRRDGQLIVASPYTWLESYTPRDNWLGGHLRGNRPLKTFDALRRILSPHFNPVRRQDVPFLLREHARKYQLGLSEASLWVRR